MTQSCREIIYGTSEVAQCRILKTWYFINLHLLIFALVKGHYADILAPCQAITAAYLMNNNAIHLTM